MTTRATTLTIAIASVGLATLAACGTSSAGQAVGGQAPTTVVTVTAPPAQATQATPPAIPAAPVQDNGGAQPPVVARTQGSVEILAGPALTPLAPPSGPAGSSSAVQLTSGTDEANPQIVTDTQGMTLYRFDKDTANPPKSNCDGDCATAWPPLLVKSPGKIYTAGVDPSVVGYVERADHTCQVTINGWPVYRFAMDKRPGDVLGQGVKGTWFAVDAQGGKAAVAQSTSTQAGSGY
jgi:predicted lipoprotein with Yx(FWY)xxD motif